MTLVTSLIFYIVNAVTSLMLDTLSGNGTLTLPFVSKKLHNLTSYESQIMQQIVQPEAITERLDDIGGLSYIKEEIRAQVLLPLKYPKLFFTETHALRPPRGILLHGPPGTGKTMLARAIAAEANVPFFALTLSTLENKFYGESSKLLSATFSLARKMQPCVLFFDEIDGMIRMRSELDQSCVYAFKTEFLMHMDGIGKRKDDAVIVMGCTNCASKLDQAVSRRLPQQYQVNLPTKSELIDIFVLNLKDAHMNRNEIEEVVDCMVEGCSGSDVVEIVRAAWALQLQQAVTTDTFQKRIQDDKATAEDLKQWVGAVKQRHVMDVLSKKRWLRYSSSPAESDCEEDVPPSLETHD